MKTTILSSYFMLVTSAVLYGFLVFGGKIMSLYGFSLMEILIYPNVIVVIVLGLLSKPEFKKFFAFPLWVTLLYILSIVSCQLGQFAPLFLGLSVSLTVFLLYTQPLWTTLISVLFFKTKITRKEIILSVGVLLGLFFLLAPWKEFTLSLPGFILALIGGVSMAGWIIISASFYAQKQLKPLSITFFTNVYQSVPFLLVWPLIIRFFPHSALSSVSFDQGINAFFLVFLYSVLVFIGAQMLFYKAARRINNIHLGLVLLLEPVTAVLLDVVFLGTSLSWNILIGGALILGSNAYLVIQSTRHQIRE